MWNHVETDAYSSISLHDCRAEDVRLEGDKLTIRFPDGFWITPASKHIDHDRPLKTDPAQLCIVGVNSDDTVDLFKTTYLFRKPVFCRRITMELPAFLKLINDGKHQLEFLYEYHRPGKVLYQCWLWKKNHGMEAECQFELSTQRIEYRWNNILSDHEW